MTRRLAAACTVGLLGLAPLLAQSVSEPGLQVELVAAGLSVPTTMAFVGDGDILVLQKNDGKVRRVLGGALQAAPVLDVAVHFLSERGLLGIATDPDFVNNRFVYLSYTESGTGADTSDSASTPLGNRVYRYTWNGAGTGALTDPVLVLDLPATPGPNHDGGIITFGPDDALYAVIGDLNRSGQLQNFPSGPPPDDTSVILRVDTAGRPLFDNPLFDDQNLSDPLNRYFAYGIRNSFGLAFDPVTGALWDTENGPTFYDEVNRVVPGFNSGWVPIMGPDGRDPQGIGDLVLVPGGIYRDPEFSWAVPVAPTAIAFVASRAMGCGLEHDLLVGDNNCGQIYRFRPNAGRDGLAFSSPPLLDQVADNSGAVCSAEMGEILFGTNFGVVTDLENGPDGKLYVVSLSKGAIYRIGPKPASISDADGDGADDACDCAPFDASAFAAPAEVPRMRLGGAAPTTLGWSPQAATAGAATSYAVASGALGALRRDRGFASACSLGSGLAATALPESRPDPPPGEGYYYLVRAVNACGSGTFGDGTGSPDPRDLLDAAYPAACTCTSRTGGAFVSFSIAGDALTVWVTNTSFIDQAKQLLATGTTQIPIFNQLLDGKDCDPQWTWHPDPQDVVFADVAVEVCDGRPSFVEANKSYWLYQVGFYCPWSAVVTAVDDRRKAS